MHLITVFVNDQFDARFFFLYLFIPILYMFEQPSAHHQESQLYQSNLWYMSLWKQFNDPKLQKVYLKMSGVTYRWW